MAAVAAPIGTLMKKIQCQLIVSVRTPPASRPIEPPAEATNANTPIALACSAGARNIVTIIPRRTAEVNAPRTPWENGATTSIACDVDAPQITEQTVNTARPDRNTP